MNDIILSVGVMTGNSLDGVDVVLCAFGGSRGIVDLATYFSSNSPQLVTALLLLRKCVSESAGNVDQAVLAYNKVGQSADPKVSPFESLNRAYIDTIELAIRGVIDAARADASIVAQYDLSRIDVIGFHGQTLAHRPPSVAKSKNRSQIYTVQLGDGQMLADRLECAVVCDFRSDDLMNGGEGAPLAPLHHQHLAEYLSRQGIFPVAFCNAGNTGNVSVISKRSDSENVCVVGWDCGPFNHFSDLLMRTERNRPCDVGGSEGRLGVVDRALLQHLFDGAAVTSDGKNFLLAPPPKSSDPQWYRLTPELAGTAPVGGRVLPFCDRLRTAQYFAAYAFVHSLTLLPDLMELPRHFALCGGGWSNPLCRQDFEDLITGDFDRHVILEQHKAALRALAERCRRSLSLVAEVKNSKHYGFDGTAMEARIFADAAVCRLKNEPFTLPATTGTAKPTIAGRIFFPGGVTAGSSTRVQAMLKAYNSIESTLSTLQGSPIWSRASAGWFVRIDQVAASKHPNVDLRNM